VGTREAVESSSSKVTPLFGLVVFFTAMMRLVLACLLGCSHEGAAAFAGTCAHGSSMNTACN
jgi:hypothetical protein